MRPYKKLFLPIAISFQNAEKSRAVLRASVNFFLKLATYISTAIDRIAHSIVGNCLDADSSVASQRHFFIQETWREACLPLVFSQTGSKKNAETCRFLHRFGNWRLIFSNSN
ncbi:MAG: hypothetical protein M1438_02625 [Deltaproteobacteria bacterium]|nr:hypothetical protein [Deltaproteobacteria bacterium]